MKNVITELHRSASCRLHIAQALRLCSTDGIRGVEEHRAGFIVLTQLSGSLLCQVETNAFIIESQSYAVYWRSPDLLHLLNPTPPLINLQNLPIHLDPFSPEDPPNLLCYTLEIVRSERENGRARAGEADA